MPITDNSGVAGQSELLADFNALIRQFEKEGLFNVIFSPYLFLNIVIILIAYFLLSLLPPLLYELHVQPDIKHVIYRMAEIFVIFALGFYCLGRDQLLLFAILLGIGEGRCGWFMHEGGHYSLTGPFTKLHLCM